MKFSSSIAVLLVISALAHAQVPDSLQLRYDSLVRTKSSGFDSAATRINNRIDSIQLRTNAILKPNLSTDQIFTRFRQRRPQATDTLAAAKELDSIKGGLQHKIDSLSKLNLPIDKYKRKFDSVSQISPEKYLAQVQGKAGDLQSKVNKPLDELVSKINKPINDVESKVNEKFDLMNKEGGAAANLPGSANVNDLNLPTSELKTSLNLNTDVDLKVPGMSDIIPLSNKNPMAGEMEQFGDLEEKINGLKSIPQKQADRLKSIDEVEAIQGRTTQANQLVDKAQAYQQDVSNIAKGDLGKVEEIPKAIENKVAGMAEMKELQEHTGEITKYQDMLAKGNDPEAMRQMAKQQAVKYATDHFAGKQEALQAAIDKVSKLKSKYDEVSTIKDLKRERNPMGAKPFIERLVPGFTFQIQKGSTFMLDFSPVIGYRFTGRFTAGAGWNERLSFSEWNKVVMQDRIYGPRVFSSFGLKKGFSIKAEVERMNVYLPTGTIDGNRAWVWSVFAGLKKDYTFFKNVKGGDSA